MCATLRHRGPDDEGVHTDPATGVTIGARRLAVMDVEGGHQPLCNEDGSVWVAFNGEIYNHRKLRADLQARGHRFLTNGDTEVLVHLYEEFGDALVHALEGMFAFALWDAGKRRLLLARDRFGEKPLFLHEHDGELIFASELTTLVEIKPDLRELEPKAIDAFFVFAYVPGPGTIVPRVRQLPPGQLLTWERGHGASQRPWWTAAPQGVRVDEPFDAVAAEAAQLFEESVKTRMIADVPVGVFLSGGVDSTLVAAAAARQTSQRLRTFTIGYDTGSVNETLQARRVAARLGSEHHELTLTQDDVAAQAPALLAALDQPLADRALLPLHVLSHFARPRVTVALGGEGADEVLGGYPRYRWLERASRAEQALPEPALASLRGLMRQGGRLAPRSRALMRLTPAPLLERHLDWVTAGRRHLRGALYGPRLRGLDGGGLLGNLSLRAGELNGNSPARWLMHLDQIDYLPDDVLVKTDRASMLVSLEIRTVFLHGGLADLAASVDTSLHLRGGGKALAHRMLPPGLLATGRLGRYRKTAFRVPAAEWLRGPLKASLEQQLQSGLIFEQGYFDRQAAQGLAREHLSGSRDRSEELWPLLALGLWVDRFCGLDGS
jgi:asparagine synthase (glutamine-hydrolysing)